MPIVQIDKPTGYSSNIVLIESPDPGNPSRERIGTGAVIGPHTILTASHVLWDNTNHTTPEYYYIYPDYDGPDPQMKGGYISTGEQIHYYEVGSDGKENIEEIPFDFGIIDTDYTFDSWFGIETDWQGGSAVSAGYPSEQEGWAASQVGSINTTSGYIFPDPAYPGTYNNNTNSLNILHGMSGGPILGYTDYLVGINSTDLSENQITSFEWNQIVQWVTDDGYSLGDPPILFYAPVPSYASTPNPVNVKDYDYTNLVIMQNATTGQMGIWTLNGTQVEISNLQIYAQNSKIFSNPVGGMELISQDPTGQMYVQTFSGIFRTVGWDDDVGGAISLNAGPSWTPISSGNFNADNQPDILLQNHSTGQAAIWNLNGTNVIGGGFINLNPGPIWNAISTGDFNNDYHSDILWQNKVTGQAATWNLDSNGNVISGGFIDLQPGPSWHAISSGNFFYDGGRDILFQNDSGQVAIWQTDGADHVIGGGTLSIDPGPLWHALGTGDTGTDILFQNDNGQIAVWDMNGTHIVGGGSLSVNAGSAWQVKQIKA